jgi:hypothetical protein
MARTNRNKVADAHHGSCGGSIGVPRGNLLDEREANAYFLLNLIGAKCVTSWRLV